MKDFPIFAGLTAAELKLIASEAQSKCFADGEIVFKGGSPIREVAILLTGSVEISTMGFGGNKVTEITLWTIEPGEFFGRLAGFNSNHGHTAQAVGASMALVWDPFEFEKLLARIPRFRRNIGAALERRLLEMEKRYKQMKKQTKDNPALLPWLPRIGR